MPAAADLSDPHSPRHTGPDEALRAGCERDLAGLEAVAQAAAELALAIQRRTLAAMTEEDDVHGVPSRAIIAFNRAARVQRQTVMLSLKVRRELRGWDKQRPDPKPQAADTDPDWDLEDRIETAQARLADRDHAPDHQVECLALEAEEQLERETFDPALSASVSRQIITLRDQLDFARRLADIEPEPPAPEPDLPDPASAPVGASP